MKRLARVALGLAGVGALGLALAAIPAQKEYERLTADLPDVHLLDTFEPPEATVLYDRHGQVLGELYEERRYVLPIEEIPPLVRDAFIAAEDANFHSHGGIDYLGIVRAVIRNADEGRMAQGASTITQQVVRNLLLLNREKTVERKLREAVLAWRLEEAYEKDQILFFYLNTIYLGSQAYGVEAAARTYFGKHAKDLSLAEAAVLAGLPQRPSDYSPYKNMSAAKARQRYVLDQMVDKEMVDQATADAAAAAELQLVPPDNHFLDNAPHFTEHVRRLLVERFGEETVNKGGLRVTTTCDLAMQRLAQEAVAAQVTKEDRKSGFRRASVTTLDDEDAIGVWRETQEEQLRGEAVHSILEDGRVYDAVILGIASERMRVGVGDNELMLSIADHKWVHPQHQAWSFTDRVIDPRLAVMAAAPPAAVDPAAPVDPATAPVVAAPPPPPRGDPLFYVGDLIKVEVDLDRRIKDRKGKELPAAVIYQPRELEAALLSMELDSGAVRALVGGADFTSSQFNRAIQGRRQVGSTFKPFVYAAAIESKKVTAATLVPDEPVAIPLAGGKVWQPKNYGDKYSGPMTLARGLAESKNVVLVRTLILADEWMNRDLVYKFARRLGLGGPPTGELPEGSRPTPDDEYLCPWTTEWVSSVFCLDHYPPREDEAEVPIQKHRPSVKRDTRHYCRSCDYTVGLGSASLTLEEVVRGYSTFGTGGQMVQPYYIESVEDRYGNVIFTAEPKKTPVVEEGVATVVNFMLQGVVQRGTATKARELKLPIAGKTGTTNEGRDAWFIGMTPDVLTGVWVGFDTPQSMGERATGGKMALPIWMDYMKVAAAEVKNQWPAPPGSRKKGEPPAPTGGVEWVPISEASGLKGDGGRMYPFLPGTVPKLAPPVEVLPEDPNAPVVPVEE